MTAELWKHMKGIKQEAQDLKLGARCLSAHAHTLWRTHTLSCEVRFWCLAAEELIERGGRERERQDTLMCLHHMLLPTDGCRSPQALEQLIAFAGDTAAADKVKDKPSVLNSSPALLAQIGASKYTQICAMCLPALLLHNIFKASICAQYG